MNARSISPMLATLGRPPVRFADFAVEAKYDGQRGLAVVDRGTVALLSRNGVDITRTFPEITTALARSDRSLVLDGEIVALDESGVPSFSRLQQRWPQNRRPRAALLRRVPVRYFVFDVLQADGRDLIREPYSARRALLEEVASTDVGVVQFPANWAGADPAVVLAASAELGLEGIVCKHMDSPYTPGLRSRDWIKTPHRKRSEFVIGGWLPGMGINRHTVGAVLVGAHTTDGSLTFCGAVGAGLSGIERRRLTSALTPFRRSTSPFAATPSDIAPYASWVEPVLVGDVEYREMNRSTLRHPSWKGLRVDVASDLVALPA
ncbi:non-homologous end-joining DNA ligase [Mycobacterium sp. URHB0021]